MKHPSAIHIPLLHTWHQITANTWIATVQQMPHFPLFKDMWIFLMTECVVEVPSGQYDLLFSQMRTSSFWQREWERASAMIRTPYTITSFDEHPSDLVLPWCLGSQPEKFRNSSRTCATNDQLWDIWDNPLCTSGGGKYIAHLLCDCSLHVGISAELLETNAAVSTC